LAEGLEAAEEQEAPPVAEGLAEGGDLRDGETA
jgi:hypothetical protein